MLMSVAAMLGLLDRLRFQPFPDICDLAVEAEQAAGDDGLDGRIAVDRIVAPGLRSCSRSRRA